MGRTAKESVRVWPLVLLATFLLSPNLCSQGQERSKIMDQKFSRLRAEFENKMRELTADYESKISTLNQDVVELKTQLADFRDTADPSLLAASIDSLMDADQSRQGIAFLGQTTIWDNTFNPAISLVGDFVLALSDRDDGASVYNEFNLRNVELGVRGRVDPLLSYVVYVNFGVDEIELEEAYGLANDWLPDTFTLKFGRHNIDFGKLAIIHPHDLPWVDHAGVIQEYLGGNLRGTGLELHHWFGVGDTSLIRWSVGVVNQLDGDDHPIVGPLVGADFGDATGQPFGKSSIENFAFHARVSALMEVGEESSLQIGGSVALAPEVQQFFLNETGILPFDDKKNLKKLVAGIDLTWRWVDEVDGRSVTIGSEVFFNNQRNLDESSALATNESSWGGYLWAEYVPSVNWSVGASVDWFQRAEDSDSEWFDVGAWVTWNVDHFNRLRSEARYVNDGLADENYWVLMFQWITILGSHGHGVDW